MAKLCLYSCRYQVFTWDDADGKKVGNSKEGQRGRGEGAGGLPEEGCWDWKGEGTVEGCYPGQGDSGHPHT